MEQHATVSISVRVPVGDWERLMILADQWGLVCGNRPNVSEAARQVMALGLEVGLGAVSGEAEPEEVPPDD